MFNVTDELQPGVFVVSQMPTRSECLQASATVKGFIRRGNYFVVHHSGNNLYHVYLAQKFVRNIKKTRAVVQQLTGADNPGWTYSRMAREITAWLNIDQKPYERARELIPRWHYQSVLPGYTEGARICDIKAAYWQVVERVVSPRFDLVDGRILWRSISAEQESKWEAMKTQLKPLKKLRLAIVGVNSAGWNKGVSQDFYAAEVFHAGALWQDKGKYPASLQPMALLSVRSVYELCQIQSGLSKSIYSNADCVCTELMGGMHYWEEAGIEYGIRAEGAGAIHAVGGWKIGDQQTEPYADYSQAKIWKPFQPLQLEYTGWHRQALGLSN